MIVFYAMFLLLILIFIGGTVLFFLAKFSWFKIASNYQTTEQFKRIAINWSSVLINKQGGYQRTIHLVICQEGLNLIPIKLLQIGFHKPVFIPWEAMKSMKEEQHFHLTFFKVTLNDNTTLRLPLKVKQAMGKKGIRM